MQLGRVCRGLDGAYSTESLEEKVSEDKDEEEKGITRRRETRRDAREAILEGEKGGVGGDGEVAVSLFDVSKLSLFGPHRFTPNGTATSLSSKLTITAPIFDKKCFLRYRHRVHENIRQIRR